MSGFGPEGSLPTGSVHDLGDSTGSPPTVSSHPEWQNQKIIRERERFRISYKQRHKPFKPHPRSEFRYEAINVAPARVTFSGTEVWSSGGGNAVVSFSGVEVWNQGNPGPMNDSFVGAEVWSTGSGTLDVHVSFTSAEVWNTGNALLRSSWVGVEVWSFLPYYPPPFFPFYKQARNQWARRHHRLRRRTAKRWVHKNARRVILFVNT